MNSNKKKGRRETFIETILKKEDGKETHYNVLTKESYNELLKEVKQAKCAEKKTALQYRRLKRFDITENGGVQKLIAVSDNGEVKYYLTVDEVFDVIEIAHAALKHGGRDRMKSELSKQYANVTFEMINLYIDMCAVCQQKKKDKKQNNRGPASNPMLEMNIHCRVDVIDFQTQADGDYKFIMVYQDLRTKFVLLRALKTNGTEEVAYQLNDIFMTFGVPHVILSDNSENFAQGVMRTLAKVWQELNVIYQKPDHAQSQESVERAKDETEKKISHWMEVNNSKNWSEGIRFVQFTMNTAFHPGIKQSPYRALFGTDPRIRLAGSPVPSEVNDKSLTDGNCVPSVAENMEEENNKRKDKKTEGKDLPESSGKLETVKSNCNLETAHAKLENDVSTKRLNSHRSTTSHLVADTGRGHLLRDAAERTMILDQEHGAYRPGRTNGVLKKLLSRPPFELVECGEDATMVEEDSHGRPHSILESILENPIMTNRNINQTQKRPLHDDSEKQTNGVSSDAKHLSSADATRLKMEMQQLLHKKLCIERQNDGGESGSISGGVETAHSSSQQFSEVLIKEEVSLVDTQLAKSDFGNVEEQSIIVIKQENLDFPDEYNPLDTTNMG